jgi:PAS domain-containing protein
MNPSESLASFYNENSNYSDATYRQFMAPNIELGISDEEGSVDESTEENQDDNLTRKRKVHRDIEAQRRATENKHIRELSSLIINSHDPKSSKLPQLSLLQMAADLLDNINLRYQYDPLRPSYLTETEINFLNLEASNAFLFVTTIESSLYTIIHVSDSIQRTLHITSEQWLDHNLLTFIHPEDLFQVQAQLLTLTQRMDKKFSIKCRLKQGNGSYLLVIIDGMIKKIDQSLKPVSTNEWGYFAFIGICHLPLTSEYSEKNMSLYKNSQVLIFSCRCSPNDWKIFLVDRSISTFPLISFDLFRNKSILEFIFIDEQQYVHHALLNSTLTSKDELITCHFIYSPTEILTMILDIKPFFNPSTKRTDFIELTFKNITDLVKN